VRCNPEAFTLSEAIATGPGNKTAEAKTPASAQCTASLPAIFWSFFKIGAFTFGGGWAMIPLIRRELVLRKRWLEDSEFVDLLAVAQSAPGPIATVFKGMRPAIFGLLVSAVWQVGKTSIKTRADLAFLVAAAVLLLALKLNPIAVIAAAALAGVAAGRFTARGADQSGPAPPRREKRPGEEG
jgi:chromate transporter